MEKTNERFCQSCGMPMGATDKLYGTEADGSKSKDYCSYCYDKGVFTFKGDMEEMIKICVAPMAKSNLDMTEERAAAMMREFFPTLKRWQTK